MSEALTRDKELTLKIAGQIEDLRRYKDSAHLDDLVSLVERLLGKDHILMPIIHTVFYGKSGCVAGISPKFISEGVHEAIASMNNNEMTATMEALEADEEKEEKKYGCEDGVVVVEGDDEEEKMIVEKEETTPEDNNDGDSKAVVSAAAATGAAAAVTATATAAAAVKRNDSLKYNPIGPDVFLETGKVVGQNSTRLAGQVIVGVSAAFLVWDAIDLGWTVTDLIRYGFRLMVC